jgi:hypothetical protein
MEPDFLCVVVSKQETSGFDPFVRVPLFVWSSTLNVFLEKRDGARLGNTPSTLTHLQIIIDRRI